MEVPTKNFTLEERLNHLKTNFISIIELKDNNLHIFETLKTRIEIMKQTYNQFIRSYKQNLFVFTLDSFHFQGKLIDIEFEEMTRIFDAILNKMYCEYYKLLKIIVEYVNENIDDEKILNLIKVNNEFPVYKDLEPYRKYDFQYVKEIHDNIIVILGSIHSFILNKEHDLKIYNEKNQIGFNIDNFVHTFNFNNNMMKEKVTLFVVYIEFFHKMHSKYLSRFTTKIQLMLSQVNYDIKFDGNVTNSTKQTNRQVLKTLKHDIPTDDRDLIKEIRHTITDEDSSDSLTEMNDVQSSQKNTAVFHYRSNPSPKSTMPVYTSIETLETLETIKESEIVQPSETLDMDIKTPEEGEEYVFQIDPEIVQPSESDETKSEEEEGDIIFGAFESGVIV